jgi:pyruvate dehydrogenase phosphatase
VITIVFGVILTPAVGHAGHATANHVVSTLPGLLKSALAAAVQSPVTASLISEVLGRTIAAYDDALTQDLFSIFPGGVDEILKSSKEDIDRIINGNDANHAKVARCMQGSTVLISLLDPSRENVWVASLGDCQAGIVYCSYTRPDSDIMMQRLA